MEAENKEMYTWIEFYTKFANRLLDFKADRSGLVEIIKQVYINTEIKMPTMENGEFLDVDPFTTIGIFNRGNTDANRIKLITEFKNLLHVDASIPKDFAALPVLNPQKSTFYYFSGERGNNDIDNLWGAFEACLQYADNPNETNKELLIDYYDTCQNQKGVKWNLTMGLFWVRPNTYLNLDKVNRDFICDKLNIDKPACFDMLKKDNVVPDGRTYLEICNKILEMIDNRQIPYNNLPELSFAARKDSRDNEIIKTANFDKLDAVFLLSEYLLVEKGLKKRKEAVQYVSNVMRGKAIEDGLNISDSYRSTGGIRVQMTAMEGAVKGVEVAPELFKEIANIYLTDKEAYKKLVDEAYIHFNIENPKRAWLLTWNPNNWEWKDYDEAIAKASPLQPYILGWASQSQQPQIGDTVYFMVLGKDDNNAIVASGAVYRDSYESDHWNLEKRNEGKKVNKIDVAFNKIVDWRIGEGIKQSQLKELFPEQKWDPMGTGISIKEKYIDDLEKLWNGKAIEQDYYPKQYSRKKVNQSLLIAGITLPVASYSSIKNCLGIDKLDKGDREIVTVVLNGKEYPATITNVNHSEKYANRTVIQLLYANSSDIAQALQGVFKYSYQKLVLNKLAKDEAADVEEVTDVTDTEEPTVEEYYELWGLPDKKLEIKCFPKEEKSVVLEMKPEEILKRTKAYIDAQGFTYEDSLIDNLYLCLKAKPFVILAGTSGTGKTRLVKLFAEAIGANKDNGRFLLVPVRPDWSDSSDLFGHVDLEGNFVEGPIIEFIKQASENSDYPYFLCLDEMNLARVEYYLSDYLSVVETRDLKNGEITTDNLITKSLLGEKSDYKAMGLPSNLYVIGTVNMDETTFPFSKKVLDRANTIEFNYVDLKTNFKAHSETNEVVALDNVGNSFLQAEYLKLQDCVTKLPEEAGFIDDICEKLYELNEVLKTANLHVGYRVRDEIVFYMLNNKKDSIIMEQKVGAEAGNLVPNNNMAFDYAVLQKILPRINGSGKIVERLLEKIYVWLINEKNRIDTITDCDSKDTLIALNEVPRDKLPDYDFKAKLKAGQCAYPKSAQKIAEMYRRAKDDGFVSYWI